MIITRIEEGTGKRYRVFGNERFLFSLYGKELKQFHIQEDCELSSETIAQILNDIIYKRARERALYLLERKPFSVKMMQDKLKQNDYPNSIIERVIDFLCKYRYLDDNNYIQMYVSSYSTSKSYKQLVIDLRKKGIAKDLIDVYFENNEYSEQKSFVKQYYRYIRGKNLEDYVVRQKVFQHFYRKGFSISLIERYIRGDDEISLTD